MSWRVPQEEHERVSETGAFPSLDRVSETLCLLHYVTKTSHLYSLRDFSRHFCLSRAAAHSDCCFFTNILTYLLTYLHAHFLSRYINMVFKSATRDENTNTTHFVWRFTDVNRKTGNISSQPHFQDDENMQLRTSKYAKLTLSYSKFFHALPRYAGGMVALWMWLKRKL